MIHELVSSWGPPRTYDCLLLGKMIPRALTRKQGTGLAGQVGTLAH